MIDGLLARAGTDLRSRWRAALAFHLFVQLLGVAALTPLATWAASRLVLASGEPVISNFDIARFVLSPIGAAFVVVIPALSIALLLAGFTGHSYIAGHAIGRRPVTVAATVLFVLRRLPLLVQLAARLILRLMVLALPFLAAGALVGLATLHGHDINFYLAEQPPEWRRALQIAAMLAAAYALLAAWQLARWLFAVPILALEGAGPSQALAQSTRMTRGQLGQIVPPLLLWWAAVTAGAIAIGWVARLASDAGLDWAGIDVRRVLPLVALYLVVTAVGAFLYSGLLFAGHQFLVTRLYAELRDPGTRQAPGMATEQSERARVIARPVAALTLAVVIGALGTAAVLIRQLDLTEDVAITAHRGAKSVAPENTLAAFRAAMDAGATYAELDVQHTRDRVLVVVHDGDLMRMAGDPRKVGALTAAEIAAIDVGRKFGERFDGESPPTLEEVIDLVRGRMRLNIELKYNVADPGLAPAVVDLLRREDFLDQAVITSLDYAALRQTELLEPRLRTGHIVTAAVGNVVRTEADFLSLNAARATPSLIRRAHSVGKEVHVWTVNEPELMLRMIERGADNLITDDPALLSRVMQERNGLTTAEILGLRLRVLFSRPPRALTDPSAVEPL
jgi:glycerophosphoryl diester phosphodiesterase